MKQINKWIVFLLSLVVLSSCDHAIKTSSAVYEDGSVNKSITFKQTDDSQASSNYFGISPEQGWEILENIENVESDSSKTSVQIQLSKNFSSVDAANLALDIKSDTLFQIHSEFRKSFRWFYTYLYYADTYRAINRFRYVPATDYLTAEDFAFIDRLPAEGQSLAKVDSIYLETLSNKIYEEYLTAVLFEEQFELIKTLITKSDLDQSWLDTLDANRDYLYKMTLDDKELPDLEARSFIDSLSIPLDESSNTLYDELYRELESRVDFMSWANDGKYEHTISLPWELMETNADSVAGNILMWNPPTFKFLFKDYTMYGESRKLNTWAIVVSVLLIMATLVSLIVRRRSRP